MPHLALGRLGTVFDLLRLDPNAFVGDALGIGLRLAHQRRQPLAEIRGGCFRKAVVNLAGIDQVLAFAPADVEPIPFAAVECEAGDRQRFPLGARSSSPTRCRGRKCSGCPGDLLDRGGQRRFDESGEGRFDADRGWVFTLKRHNKLRQRHRKCKGRSASRSRTRCRRLTRTSGVGKRRRRGPAWGSWGLKAGPRRTTEQELRGPAHLTVPVRRGS